MSVDSTLHKILLSVENPARYVGGEFGAIAKRTGVDLRIAICFPDLYEIGMSNTALKIIYSLLNKRAGIACERVFAVGPDYETALRKHGIPLSTLETQTPLSELDLLGFSFGYEMLATNVLQVLELGKIALLSGDRPENAPIVIAGGPGISNPLPFARIFDAVFIGEAEAGFLEIAETDRKNKRSGASRVERLDAIRSHPSMWYRGKPSTARRAIWNGFGTEECEGATFPVPSIRVAQDHGVVEIMRGCPQGCRFCHAGVYYRPYRMKGIEAIQREVEQLVETYGYRDITLSSLSSGDYANIESLIQVLDDRFGSRKISFQLPSLRVNSVSLPLIEQLSRVKRAGLTFAVETADVAHQRAINKLVPVERTEAILREAWDRGWRKAKFYFMVGLPLTGTANENEAILQYIERLQRAVKMEFSVNVGVFVPKPHTPFQWSPQLGEADAHDQLTSLKRSMPRRVKLNYPDPFVAILEGIIARGDERVGDMIMAAYDLGCRLDAWDEHMNKTAWRQVVREYPSTRTIREGFAVDDPLPWQGVATGVGKGVLLREYRRSQAAELTQRCLPACRETCGVCNRRDKVVDLNKEHDTQPRVLDKVGVPVTVEQVDQTRYGLLVRYQKENAAGYLSHLSTLRLFERVWYRAALPLAFSKGYNPKPKFSFAQPLPVGMESSDEYVLVEVTKKIHPDNYSRVINKVLPSGFGVVSAWVLESSGTRIPSPMFLFAGARYLIRAADGEVLPKEVQSLLRVPGIVDGELVSSSAIAITIEAGVLPGINKLIQKTLRAEIWPDVRVKRIATFGRSLEGMLVPLAECYVDFA